MKKFSFLLTFLILTTSFCFAQSDSLKPKEKKGEKMTKNEVTIKWLGHSMFLLNLDDKVKMVTDPFDKSVGYPIPDVSADIVLVSHRHFDHDNVKAVKGKPEVVEGVGEKTVKGVKIKGIAAAHDEKGGTLRGKDTIFVWELGGIRFAHLGDLGAMLSEAQIKEIGTIDVLFIPVGGFFTIDSGVATQVVSALNPKVVIPMHYKTAVMGPSFPISSVDEFLKDKKNVQKVGKNSIVFSKEKLPKETTIFVLDYK
jgi:L-ascorbate metabolism protein UlaG (beta-lactamase superfamily)